jgi:hypothetical protein
MKYCMDKKSRINGEAITDSTTPVELGDRCSRAGLGSRFNPRGWADAPRGSRIGAIVLESALGLSRSDFRRQSVVRGLDRGLDGGGGSVPSAHIGAAALFIPEKASFTGVLLDPEQELGLRRPRSSRRPS